MAIDVSTRTKLKIARCLYGFARTFNRLTGKTSDHIVCKRRGITWNLDISEGIDLAIYLFGRFETSTSKSIEKILRPGMTVLDIGANIGAHALPMAKHVGPGGRVFAIEPTDYAFAKLNQNIALNPDLQAQIVPVNAAFVGDASQDLGEIYASWRVVGGVDVHEVHGGRACATDNARRIRLDDFVEEQAILEVSLIKLDVDGFEYHVLSGAQKTLKRDLPVIIMEFAPYIHQEHGASFEALVGLLVDLGYSFSKEGSGRLLPHTAGEIEALIPVGGCINVVASART